MMKFASQRFSDRFKRFRALQKCSAEGINALARQMPRVLGVTCRQVLLCVGLSSVMLGSCRLDDCPGLPTQQGERLVVTVDGQVKLCGQITLRNGAQFLLDMEDGYSDPMVENCPMRMSNLAVLPDEYAVNLSQCSTGQGGGPHFDCSGTDEARGCQLGAKLFFPTPPSEGYVRATGQLEVRWSPSCWPDVCYGGPIDKYNVTVERVGMGWVPPSN